VVRVVGADGDEPFGEAEAALAVSLLRFLVRWVGRTHRVWREILGPAVPMVERWIVNEARHNPSHPLLREVMGLLEEYRRRKGWRR